jgi:hypothetical protein
VTNGFGWGYQANHPNPRSHPHAIFPDIACRYDHDAPPTTVGTLETVPDPRDRRGVRYSLAGVLALAVTATVAGCRSFAAIGQWAAETRADKLASFGLAGGGVPDESTLR